MNIEDSNPTDDSAIKVNPTEVLKHGINSSFMQLTTLGIVSMICLLPFICKPMHIDDPLYIWTAKNILSSPADFYGYRINWDWGLELPASEIIKNPPGMSYLLALAGIACHWNEIWLHVLVAVIAIFLIFGTYYLARELDADPEIASLLTLCTPIYMMSATVVMGDILMATSWVWAVFFWVRGSHKTDHACLAASVLLITVSFFTKYFGICLVPLLAAYQISKRRNFKICLPYLVIPIILAALYQVWTFRLYGRGLLFDAVRFSVVSKGSTPGFFEQGFISLVFVGGGMISVLLILPLIFQKRAVFYAGFLMFLAFALCLSIKGRYAGYPLWGTDGFQWLLMLHAAFFGAIGTGIILVAVYALIKERTAESILLLLWIGGTIIFTTYLNWTISGRNLLPCLPAVGVLVARCLPTTNVLLSRRLKYSLFIPSLLISLMVAWGDSSHADSAKRAVAMISNIRLTESQEIWFQGHWGFQYYMELHRGKAVDLINGNNKKTSDILVIPSNNSFTRSPDMDTVDLIDKITLRVNDTVSVMNKSAGAGYYASARGPLPYIFGKKHDETYYIFRYRQK